MMRPSLGRVVCAAALSAALFAGVAKAEEPLSAPSGTAGAPAPVTSPSYTTGAEAAPAPAMNSAEMPAAGANAVVTTPSGTAVPQTSRTASGIRPGERLSLERCIELGLNRNPSVVAAGSATNAAAARVGQAQSAYYPQVTLSGSYSKFSSYADPSNSSQDLYQGTASLTQNIFDFGKTPSQVKIQRLNESAFRSDQRNTISAVAFNVKQAYYKLLQAEKNAVVAAETVKLNQDQLDQAKGFFDAGVKSKYDVTTAEVNLSNAKLAQIRADNAVRIARVTLNNAIGVPDAPDFEIEDTLAFQKSAVTFEDAVQRAYGSRPDLLAQQSRRDASRESGPRTSPPH